MPTRPPARRPLLAQHRRGGAAKGCLIAFLILVVLLIAAGIFIKMNWRTWAGDGMRSVAVAGIQKSELPKEQKDRIELRIIALTDDFKASKLSLEQLGQVFEQIAKSPVLPLAAVEGAIKKYVEPSSLSPEEKAAGRRSLERFARGMYEKKLTKADFDEVVAPIEVPSAGPNNNHQFKETVTTEELVKFLDLAKAKADAAKIPDEPFAINYADEIDKAIDTALGKAPAELPPAPQAPTGAPDTPAPGTPGTQEPPKK